MSVINTNVKSLIVQNAIKVNNRLMSSAMEQLSTGKRINSAKDDAAGLAVSENMTAQIRGLNMAVRNANDGISLLQTAEGAMIEQTNMLQRMRELSVQAANGTLSPSQRSYLNVEFNSLLDEINRIGNNTQWNGMRLLTGEMGLNSDGKIGFQVGAGTSTTETINVNIGRISAKAAVTEKTFALSDTLYTNTNTTSAVTVATGSSEAATLTIEMTPSLVAGTSDFTFSVTPTAGDTAKDVVKKLVAAVNSHATASKLVAASVDTKDPKVVVLRSLTPGKDGEVFTIANQAAPSGSWTIAGTAGNVTGTRELGDFSKASISSPADAMTSIDLVDQAINVIANQRAVIGAGINRLTYASDNLSNISQNTSESRSRILDTDYAQATTELARTQIIQQASTAVLAQANAQPQTVLKLLQG
jgi:flagellin